MHASCWLRFVVPWIASTAGLALGAAGDPDLSFGTNGATITRVGDVSEAYGLVRQADGKLVVAGQVEHGPPTNRVSSFLLIRYGSDGTVDPTFGTNGIVETPSSTPGWSTRVKSLLLQTDGKLVAVGLAAFGNYWDDGGDIILARYDSGGTLDPTFGAGGIVVTDVHGYQDQGTSAALQPDGRILVAGFARSGASLDTQDALIARYDTSGTLDPTFGTGGISTLDFDGRWDRARDLVVQSDGGIVLVGSSIEAVAPYRESVGFIARVDADGSADGAFGVAGSTELDLGLATHLGDVVLLSTGKLMTTVSYTLDGLIGSSLLARFDATGALDLGFGGGDGLIEANSPAFMMESGTPGTVLAGGAGFLWGHWFAMGISRYDENGNPDVAFGINGRASIYPGPGTWNSGAMAAVVEPDGSAITLAGFAADGPYEEYVGEPRQVAIARLVGIGASCSGDGDCSPCEHCGVGVCQKGPRATCEHPTAPGAKLMYKSDVRKPPSIRWKWRSIAGAAGFDPSTEGAGLCMWWGNLPIYESSIPPGAGWTSISGAVAFRDRSGVNQGLQKVKLSHAGLDVYAKGNHVRDNVNGFADALLQPADESIPLIVQFNAASGKCYSAGYPQASFKSSYNGHVRRATAY